MAPLDPSKLTPQQHRRRAERRRDDKRREAMQKLHVAVNRTAPAASPTPAASEVQGVFFSDPQGKAPNSNTGPISPSPLLKDPIRRLHHLRVSFPLQKEQVKPGGELVVTRLLDRAKELVTTALNVQGQERLAKTLGRKAGLWTYDNGYVWHDVEDRELAGIFWTEGRAEASIDVRGGGCDRIPPARQLALIKSLVALGAKGVRLDVAFDDYARIASMDEIHAACLAKNITGFVKYKENRPRDLRGDVTFDGDSADLGTRGNDGSGKYMRIYDKFLETKRDPNFNCIRYECELTAGYAIDALLKLAECDDVAAFQARVGQVLSGTLDFIDRAALPEGSRKKNVSRAKRLSWWDRVLHVMCATLTIALLNPDYRTSPLSRGLLHLKKQWVKKMALARLILEKGGVSFSALLDRWMDEAEVAFNNFDPQGRADLELRLPALLST